MFISNTYFIWFDNQAAYEEYPEAVVEILKAAQEVEQYTKMIYLIVAEASPVCFLLPKFCYCMYCYYVKGLGADSFELCDRTAW